MDAPLLPHLLPSPWEVAVVNATYASPTATVMYMAKHHRQKLEQRWQQQPRNVSTVLGTNATWQDVFRQLRSEGIHASSTGLELVPGRRLRRESPALAVALDALAFQSDGQRSSLFVSRGRPGNAEWARLLWEADSRIVERLPVPIQPSSDDALVQLQRDGFVKIESWAQYGLNISLLAERDVK